MTGEEIQAAAFNDFEHWQQHQDYHTVDTMPLTQQASLYANDVEWHNREDDISYIRRNT